MPGPLAPTREDTGSGAACVAEGGVRSRTLPLSWLEPMPSFSCGITGDTAFFSCSSLADSMRF